MNTQERINDLKRQLQSAEAEQKNCQHDWGNSFYNAETYKKEVPTGEYEKNGSHFWAKTKFVDDQKDRWSRKCKKCGLTQHTYKQETVKVIQQPKF